MNVTKFLNDITGGNLLAWKVGLTTAVVALAGVQILLAAGLWGVSSSPVGAARAAPLHRWNGRVVLVGAVLVGFSCLAGPAGPTSPTRVLLHSLFGSVLFAVLVAKFAFLKLVPGGGRWLPITGSALFLSFLAIWATSVADYIAR